jgi:peroxiredoxin
VRLKYRAIRIFALALCVLGVTTALRAAMPALAAAGSIGHAAPDFALPAAIGNNVRLSEYRGQPVIVSFWSSRCGLCARQLAALDRYYGTYRSSGLIVLGVSVDDDAQHAQDYAHAHVMAFPLLLDSAKAVSRAFGIERLPSTVLIDRGGVVRFLHSDDGAGDDSYVAQIRALLDDKFGGL